MTPEVDSPHTAFAKEFLDAISAIEKGAYQCRRIVLEKSSVIRAYELGVLEP
ncbi:MAG: hypothetical protein IPF82_22795 [Blastocatellia bacterium]|nr:hypothetical protein [Blastocatellia bacterium]